MLVIFIKKNKFIIVPPPKRWEVVKNSASPNRPFFWVVFCSIWCLVPFPHFGRTTLHTIISSPKGGILPMRIHFPMLPCPRLSQKGGYVPEMSPLDPPMTDNNASSTIRRHNKMNCVVQHLQVKGSLLIMMGSCTCIHP